MRLRADRGGERRCTAEFCKDLTLCPRGHQSCTAGTCTTSTASRRRSYAASVAKHSIQNSEGKGAAERSGISPDAPYIVDHVRSRASLLGLLRNQNQIEMNFADYCRPIALNPSGYRLVGTSWRVFAHRPHRFHFRLIVGLPLIKRKHAVYQPHAAKALIFAVVFA
jgi:hypothetical protein